MIFEIGKKYIGNYSNNIYTCEYVNKHGAVLSRKDSSHFAPLHDSKHYKEYKEPVVHKRWVHFYKNTNGKVMSYTHSVESWVPDPKYYTYLGRVPIEFTEKDS